MITEEKLRKIYEQVTKDNIFKTKELLEMGFKKDDLTILVNNKTLKRIKIGYYKLNDVDKLFQYGKQLLCTNVVKAREIFEICYQINPNHKETLFQLFLKSIKEENFQKAFNYLDNLIKADDNKYNQVDYNVYLYLLNQLIELPENYQDFINSFEEDDLKIKFGDSRYDDQDRHNQVRKLIFNKNNSFALSKLNYFYGFEKGVRIKIIRSLIKAVVKKEQKLSNEIIDLIKNEDYQAIIELLEKENVKNLSLYMQSILDIAKDILEIQRTKEVIQSTHESTSTIRAIYYKNYELALYLRSNYNTYIKVPNDQDALYLIIEAITIKNKEVKYGKNDNNLFIISELEKKLLSKDILNATKLIKEFLANIKKENYEVLVIKLLKLNLFRKTNNFKFVINFLKGLLDNKIELNVNDLIKEYNLSFKNNNNEKASLLLEILRELEKLGLANNITSELEIKTEDSRERKEEIMVLPVSQKEETKPDLAENNEIDLEAKAFRKTIYQRLEENDLIILNREDSLKLDITMFNKEYRSAYAFKIGTMGEVVIKATRYINPSEAYEHTKNGDEAFLNGNWEEAIKEYKEVLPLKNTFARVYANLGLAYMNLGNNLEAIKYLTIATGLSELNPLLKFNYQKLINELKGKKKSEIKKEQRDTESLNLNYYYNIYSIRGVADLINKGLTIEEAFKQLNVYSNEKNMIILLLARDCYARACFQKGDEYLSLVEKNEYKSKQVKKFLESLKANKLLYQNYVNESYKPLLGEHQNISTETPKETEHTSKVSLKELFKKAQPLVSNVAPKQELKPKDNASEDIMERRYQELKKQGELIILKRKDISKFDIEEFNKRYSDAYAFYIGEDDERKIVIQPDKPMKINVRNISNKQRNAYLNYDYNTVINEGLKLITVVKDSKAFNYGILGLAYLKKGNHSKALKYLEVATGIGKRDMIKDCDYTELICKMKKIPYQEDENAKEHVAMSEKEFASDMKDYFGSKRIKEVLLLMNFHGMSANEACTLLKLNDDERNKIYLVLARECFALNEFDFGEEYLMEVEKRDKTLTVKYFIAEIRKNKRFYSNRIDENYQPLVRERILKI